MLKMQGKMIYHMSIDHMTIFVLESFSDSVVYTKDLWHCYHIKSNSREMCASITEEL